VRLGRRLGILEGKMTPAGISR